MFEIARSVALILIVSYVILRDVSRRYTWQQIMRVTVTALILVQVALAIMPRWLRVTLAVNLLMWLLMQAYR